MLCCIDTARNDKRRGWFKAYSDTPGSRGKFVRSHVLSLRSPGNTPSHSYMLAAGCVNETNHPSCIEGYKIHSFDLNSCTSRCCVVLL